jgi:hypothetical protein
MKDLLVRQKNEQVLTAEASETSMSLSEYFGHSRFFAEPIDG